VKRSPLKRSPMRRRKGATKYSRRERDSTYMIAVKALSCLAADLSPCEGVVEADHAGRRGLGQKCSDLETISLCTLHHRQRTDWTGPFKSWDQAKMRAWLEDAIETTRARLCQ
jgi:hypothetical protein